MGVLSTPSHMAGISNLGSIRARPPVRAETYLLAFVNLGYHINFLNVSSKKSYLQIWGNHLR